MASIREYRKSANIAKDLPRKELDKIGGKVVQGYMLDKESRSDWEVTMEKALKIAKQVWEPKTQNGELKSNVKYPLITQAAIEFASRVYPELVQGGRVVRTKVIGDDPTFIKAEKASRVATYMSTYLVDLDPDWSEDLDRLLHMLPIFGTMFKKTYYDPISKRTISEIINPDRIVVNQGITSLDTARRITHVLEKSSNDIIERQRAGLYLDMSLEELTSTDDDQIPDFILEDDNRFEDEDAPIRLLEQHCFLDLDDDGYQEPYIVTVHAESGRVLRIVHRYKEVEMVDGKLRRIVPENFFVDFHFIMSPDGSYYSVGIGKLLLPLNEAINTLINQLIDSGTLNNQQSGFVGRGLRIKNGDIRVRQGEWKILDTATGNDIKNNIVPLPTKEPSVTLFQLLGLLLEVGKDLSSVNDISQGKQPAQNVPATTILTLQEQGMKVFNAITARLYRAMKKEYKRIFMLFRTYLSDKEYQEILDNALAVVKNDFDMKTMDIMPVADPAMSSDSQRIMRAQALMQLPTVDPMIATRFLLEALQIPDEQIEALMSKENRPPDPDAIKTQAEVERMKAETQNLLQETQLRVAELEIKQSSIEVQARESAARIAKMQSDSAVSIRKTQISEEKAAVEVDIADRDQLLDQAKAAADIEAEQARLAIDAVREISEDREV